ncbi:MAG: helix-turn-helix transcriptional regulator [Blautia sp.]|nr:helix-turn-helix transcriptional regulator [Blautia sp.]
MIPVYKMGEDSLQIRKIKPEHIPPHIHDYIEIVYVTKGSLALGIGTELFSLEEGDLALVFPGLIHHYHIFDKSNRRAILLFAAPHLAGVFKDDIMKFFLETPVIKANDVHPDILYILNSLLKNPVEFYEMNVYHAMIELLFARGFPFLNFIDRSFIDKGDVVQQVITYIAEHYTESVTLSDVARGIGIGKSTLSRLFSSVFHKNFNQYLNSIRLESVCNILKYTDIPITEAYLLAGFESQRTFNRAFQDVMHISPRDYRKQFHIVAEAEEQM